MFRRRASTHGSRRRRPPQMTLADIAILILGLALAFWIIRPFVSERLGAGPRPIDYLVRFADVLATLALRFALATVILVSVSRGRRGGYPRPAEWLALVLVLSWPNGPAQDLYNAFNFGLYQIASHSVVEVGSIIYALPETSISLLLALVGCLGFAAARRVIPFWAKTPVLFVLAVLLVWGAVPSLLVGASQALGPLTASWPAWLRQAAMTGSGVLASDLVLALPAVATLRDFCRRDRPAWSWCERLGATAGLAMALAWQLSKLAERLWRSSGSWATAVIDPLSLGTNAVAWALAWILISRHGAGWTRWITAGADQAE